MVRTVYPRSEKRINSKVSNLLEGAISKHKETLEKLSDDSIWDEASDSIRKKRFKALWSMLATKGIGQRRFVRWTGKEIGQAGHFVSQLPKHAHLIIKEVIPNWTVFCLYVKKNGVDSVVEYPDIGFLLLNSHLALEYYIERNSAPVGKIKKKELSKKLKYG